MVKTLIKEHLNEIVNNKHKGVKLSKYAAIKPELRPRLKEVKSKLDLSTNVWNKVLDNPEYLAVVNESKLSNEIIDTILGSDCTREKIHEILEYPNLEKVYLVIKKEYDDQKWYSSRGLSFVFCQSVLYFMKYGFDSKKSSEIVDKLLSLDKDEAEKVQHRIVEYVHMLLHPYVEFINTVHHFNKWEETDFVFFQYVYEQYEDRSDFVLIFRYLRKVLAECKDKTMMKDRIRRSFETHGYEKVLMWCKQLNPCYVTRSDNDETFPFEFTRLLSNADKVDSDDAYEIVYGKEMELYRILKVVNTSEYTIQRQFIKKCIQDKKKAFLRLINENLNDFLELTELNLLFSKEFSEFVNLNTLNKQDFTYITGLVGYAEKVFKHFDRAIPLTFKEVKFLLGKGELEARFFYKLMDLKVDQRLKICRELPPLKNVISIFGGESEESIMELILELVRNKPFKTWVREMKLSLQDAADHHYLVMLLVPEKFEKFKNEITKGVDVEFILKNQELLEYTSTLDEAKMLFIAEDDECQFMLEDLGVSKSFIEEHKSRLISFVERGLAHVYHEIHHYNRQTSLQLKNLRLITKAELAGKLDDIKFQRKDFELEIGLPIQDHTIAEWKKNRSSIGEFNIGETYDYETTIRIGETPVRSCLHWSNGSYSRCLLSNFDTNKKLLIAKDKKGQIVARSILRLTKGANEYISAKKVEKKQLEFIDVEKKDVTPTYEEGTRVKEELVLFLERPYSSLHDDQKEEVLKTFIEVAKEKADALGAKLVVSDDFVGYTNGEFEKKDYYLYISLSKNGYQYLDSMGGQSTDSNEGHYKSVEVLLEKE